MTDTKMIDVADLLDPRRFPGQSGNALRLAAATEVLQRANVPFAVEVEVGTVPYLSGPQVEVGFYIRTGDHRYTPDAVLRSFPGERVADPSEA